MEIYNYHPLTGEYVGPSLADESPLEPDVFLIPAFSTTERPPATSENQRVYFNGAAWVVVEVQAPDEPVQNDAPPDPLVERRGVILAALADIDMKSIRPLREGDSAKVAQLEAQAETLRQELRGLV